MRWYNATDDDLLEVELLLAARRSSTLLAAPRSIFAVELVELVELVLSLPNAEAGRYPRERYPYPATDGGGQPTRSGLFGMVFVVARRLVVRACVVM